MFETLSAGGREGRLFTAFGKVGIGRPVGSCLVGTVDQIVEYLLALHDRGVTRFILAGYDPTRYPAEFGATLLPKLRAAIAARARTAAAGAAA